MGKFKTGIIIHSKDVAVGRAMEFSGGAFGSDRMNLLVVDFDPATKGCAVLRYRDNGRATGRKSASKWDEGNFDRLFTQWWGKFRWLKPHPLHKRLLREYHLSSKEH